MHYGVNKVYIYSYSKIAWYTSSNMTQFQRLDNGMHCPIMRIVNSMPHDKYFALKYGQMVLVYAKLHHTTGRWFLTTEPEDTKENDLDFLPGCVGR